MVIWLEVTNASWETPTTAFLNRAVPHGKGTAQEVPIPRSRAARKFAGEVKRVNDVKTVIRIRWVRLALDVDAINPGVDMLAHETHTVKEANVWHGAELPGCSGRARTSRDVKREIRDVDGAIDE